MNTKHTPGPWTDDVVDGSLGSIDAANGVRVAQAFTVSCADIKSGYAERKANARLIAAAPELLEALKAMRIVMDSGDKPVKLDAALSWRACDEKARAMCDAAIAKATGEQA